MKQATAHSKNYETFHTVCDSASYQGGGSKPNGTANASKNWTSDWMKGNTKNTRAKVPVQENETERKLRKENDLLKVRLNAANNAIRDMENICREQEKQILCQLSTSVVAPGSVSGATSSPSSSPSPLLCFLMRNKKERQEHMDKNNDDDAQSSFSNACTSEASTVQMGSLTK